MQTSSFYRVLDRIRKATEGEAQAMKGQRFEVLMKRFFEYEPTYKERFSEVWLWNQWPYRKTEQWGNKSYSHDIGIDLVARERVSERYVAIQCKCYDDGHTLSEKDVATFFAALNMTWKTEHGSADTFVGGIVISTCYYTSSNFDKMLGNQRIPCTSIGLADLMGYEEVPWEELEKGKAHGMPKKEVRPHQREAIDAVLEAFRGGAERGKMIMACGTGKTFTSLRLAEEYTGGGHGCILFLAPSIALVSQSLREWMGQTVCRMHPIAVCSDSQVGRADDETDLAATDLPSPATTDPEQIGRNYRKFKDSHLTVIFSTYQSLDKVRDAQVAGALPEFDLTICDEAHRTAGVYFLNEEEQAEVNFRRVHDQNFLKSKRRLYMTATPKIYGQAAHEKVREENKKRRGGKQPGEKVPETVALADMNDVTLFGEELYNLRFSRAVREGLLTDYKVLVLCVDEDYVKDLMGGQLKRNEGGDFEIDDAIRLVGCINGLRKRMILPPEESMAAKMGITEREYDRERVHMLDWAEDHNNDFLRSDPDPMRRAVAFSGRIADSETYAELWKLVVKNIRESDPVGVTPFPSEMHHVDGTMHMGERERELQWLKAPNSQECRILTNAQCLSEGVDVPALDAIMFLAPKRSQIDIVQSVGRVMRRDPEGRKKFGYVIIPVGVPRDQKPEEVLGNEKRFRVVWQVLQALRAHDDRFDAEINAIEFNRRRSKHITVAGVSGPRRPKPGTSSVWPSGVGETEIVAGEPGGTDLLFDPFFFAQQVKQLRDAVFTKMVVRVGTRIYWEKWAQDIAGIADRRRHAIEALLGDPDCAARFGDFLDGLRENIRPDISEQDAIEMLAMQFVSRPVFNALFGKYRFAEQNPVSVTMNKMLDFVEEHPGQEEDKVMKRFYEDVLNQTGAIETTEGRQDVIRKLYENFFRNAFKKVADALGIVYTPVEVVDFIIHSVHRVLQVEFGIEKGLGAEGVRILDPFTGTGTFIVRAIQSGLISKDDLPRKYREELFASEIVLLAYYIACVNIEVAYHGEMGENTEYEPFSSICLTDTFRMHENSGKDRDLFPQFEDNGERVKRLCKQDIRVIIANPPYSIGQRSANDNNRNADYPKLDARIAETYAVGCNATNKKSLYDSYIRAFRWSSDCIKDDGIIAFVTNGSYIDNSAMSGFRECLMDEFSEIYCYNLRGNCRTQGELRRKEAGNVFGEGSKTPIAIIILVKRADHKPGTRATLHYCDIGDYLSRDEKLRIVKNAVDIGRLKWETLVPDKHGDWLNHRSEGYELCMPVGDKGAKKGKGGSRAVFDMFCLGVATNRDASVYNFSQKRLGSIMQDQVLQYNRYIDLYVKFGGGQSVEDFVDDGKNTVKWTRALRRDLARGKVAAFSEKYVRLASYRPFHKMWLYFDPQFNEAPGLSRDFFPTPEHKNLVITFPAAGGKKEPMPLISDTICDLHFNGDSQCFPLYWYEKRSDKAGELPLGLEESISDYRRHDGITDRALKEFRQAYGDPKIGKEDLFYYVYGLLHSEEYRTRYANDLKKELPRIPKVKDFRGYSKAGRELAEWHLNYETVEPYPLEVAHSGGDYRIEGKMRFPKKGVKDTIIYNSTTVLRCIPPEAYEYVVNGKSALEWVMERYAVTTDKDSGIVNDPNAWCDEVGDPRYIIDLVKRVVRVSVETVRIVKNLPPYEEM